MKVYQSETDEWIQMETIGTVRYVGKSFGVESLTDGREYAVIEVLEDDMIRVVDDSEEDYLYSIANPRPAFGQEEGGIWEIVEDKFGILRKWIKT